jgi:DNA-binding XRE family transcriptional regulator
LACFEKCQYAKLGGINQAVIAMQRPNPESIYFDDFQRLQKKLCARIKALRIEQGYTQEDMTEFELSVRQYQRMEQDPQAIVSLWQLYKLSKAFGIDVSELLDV